MRNKRTTKPAAGRSNSAYNPMCPCDKAHHIRLQIAANGIAVVANSKLPRKLLGVRYLLSSSAQRAVLAVVSPAVGFISMSLGMTNSNSRPRFRILGANGGATGNKRPKLALHVA